MDASHVSSEVEILKQKIKELGAKQADGLYAVTFGKLYEETVDIFEALNGTLRSAKKNKIIDFKGQMLLKGANDSTLVILLVE